VWHDLIDKKTYNKTANEKTACTEFRKKHGEWEGIQIIMRKTWRIETLEVQL